MATSPSQRKRLQTLARNRKLRLSRLDWNKKTTAAIEELRKKVAALEERVGSLETTREYDEEAGPR